MINFFVYIRSVTEMVAKLTQRAIVNATYALRFAGSSKLGITPGGGSAAGPFKSACRWASACSGVEAGVDMDITFWILTVLAVTNDKLDKE